ncbi:MAG: hypothetical protein WC455_17845 [Dehalococcoidia bacterium]|jgi:hypothetical protein
MRYYRIQAFSNGFKVIDEVWRVCRSSVLMIQHYRAAGLFVRVTPA